jgi:hypothetical protein
MRQILPQTPAWIAVSFPYCPTSKRTVMLTFASIVPISMGVSGAAAGIAAGGAALLYMAIPSSGTLAF